MDWQAQWIWGGEDPAPRNGVQQFRHRFQLEHVALPMQLHISADARYILYINGRRLGYGPVRAYPTNYHYDTYDLQDTLQIGENSIAVLVFHWGEGTFQQRVTRGGLIVQVEAPTPEDQARVLAISDATWKTKTNTAFMANTPRVACQLPWEEQYDAQLADENWTALDYDDHAWETATVIGTEEEAPWGKLHPRPVPFFTDEPIAPIAVTPQGLFQRPEVVAPVHLAPLVSPGNLTSNRRDVDLLLATVLHVPTPGTVTIRMCAIYGDIAYILIDGQAGGWHEDSFRDADDHVVTQHFEAGDHLILLDWQGRSAELDLTLTLSGVPGLQVRPPLAAEGTWSVALKPGDGRRAARSATTVSELLHSSAPWQPLPVHDTPIGDVYMDVTGSVSIGGNPPMKSRRFLPLTIPPTAPDQAQHYLIDFGRMLIGWIDLEVDSAAGTVIDLVGCEGIQEGQLQWTKQMNNSLRYICRAGPQRFVSSQRRGLRYLVVAVHHATAPVTLRRLDVRLATHPSPGRGAFRSADPRLNAIWEMCAYTLRLCTEDTFTDCPTYEQTLWIGDAYTDALVHQSVHGDPRVVARGLELAALSLRELPLVNAQIPSDWDDLDSWIPNWSWLWVLGCREYFWLTGDRDFVQRIMPALEQQASWLVARLTNHPLGLFALDGVTHLLDWADLDEGRNHIVSHEQMLAVAALRATAELAEVLAQPEAAQRWRQSAEQLRETTNRIFWSNESQAYVDSLHPDGERSTHVSQPVNILALATDIPQPIQRAAIERVLVDPPADWSPSGSPWMYSFALLELARRGRSTEMLRLIRDRWGAMLDRGATTVWETFPGWITGRWTRSWCHAWGTLPAYLLMAYVLGVRPLTPGFSHTLIAPDLSDLAWCEGVVPTPHGEIHVQIRREGEIITYSITLPENVSAELRLPGFAPEFPPQSSDEHVSFSWHEGYWQATLAHGTLFTARVRSNPR